MSDAYFIFVLIGSLTISVFGARDAFAELRSGPESLEAPKWWSWGKTLYRAWLRIGFVSWFLMPLLASVALLRIIDSDSQVAEILYSICGGYGAVVVGLIITTAVAGRPARLVPMRVRGSTVFSDRRAQS